MWNKYSGTQISLISWPMVSSTRYHGHGKYAISTHDFIRNVNTWNVRALTAFVGEVERFNVFGIVFQFFEFEESGPEISRIS